MMSIDGQKKVAIVTGGGSGLGLAIAEKFTANGIETVIVGRDEEKLKKAKAQLGECCHPVACDVSNLASIPSLIEKVMAEFGQIDILVNNAGINMKKEFVEVTDEEFQRIITTNLCSVFSMSREVVREMLKKPAPLNGGATNCIINIS